ncbi:MAG: acetyl-CoA acetyltransferase [Deltaproteobacteria bacterium]|nr:acetyl-CoA acetyltransferase [Deltaproteobacteria bacterium]
MSLDPHRTPVLVGLGQSVEREGIVDVVALASRAARKAFEDAPGLSRRIQRLTMVASSFSKVGKTLASEVAAALGLSDVACEITTPGGNTPQWLMNRACEAIAKGELETTLIAGAEATRSMKLADPDSDFLRAALENFEGQEGAADPVVGAAVLGMLGEAEIDAKLFRPAEIYPIFESVLAARAGASPEAWRKRIAAFYSRASEVAAKNPYAWFPEVRSAEAIGTASPDNRITAEPYTKLMNSFADVDLGAALLVTTLELAREAGLADQCVFPWAGASNADVVPTSRRELGGSPGIRAAAAATFEAAGLGIDDIDFFDLYSCFPVAVEVAAEEIGLSVDDSRGLTTTGFMSFFGGPGNNYTTHGIATSAQRLREGGRFAFTSGNGGLLSKHSIGLYGCEPPPSGFVHADTSEAQAQIEAAALEVVREAEGQATVVGGTVVYDRSGAVAAAPIVAALGDGRRLLAVADTSLLSELAGRSLVGETVRVSGASPPVYT